MVRATLVRLGAANALKVLLAISVILGMSIQEDTVFAILSTIISATGLPASSALSFIVLFAVLSLTVPPVPLATS